MDSTAINNLAVCSFNLLDFERAKELSERDRQLYPHLTNKLENGALFAFYSGDQDEALRLVGARNIGDRLLVAQVIPILVTALKTSPSQALADAEALEPNPWVNAAKADLLIAMGANEQAIVALENFIQADLDADNRELAARKFLMKAELLQKTEMEQCVREALLLSRSVETMASAGILLRNQQTDVLDDLANGLKREIGGKGRAFAKMLRGLVLLRDGEIGEAIHSLQAALDLLDMWLIRFCLGSMYLATGYDLDGYDQFERCEQRSSEGCFALLDDVSTYRYMHIVRTTLMTA